MKINELAQRTGVSRRALRYYEEKGLLVAEREENGYRSYAERDVAFVRQVQNYLRMGMSLEHIKRVIAGGDGHTFPVMGQLTECVFEAIELHEKRLKEVEEQLQTLTHAKDCLVKTLDTLYKNAERVRLEAHQAS